MQPEPQEQQNQEQKPLQSPSKQQRRQKKRKSQAFKSFLDNRNENGKIEVRNLSEHDQTILQEDTNQCLICKIELGDNRRYCGFCRMTVCTAHLRKKRRSKDTGKFVRICDECQDKQLFQKNMKSQLKAEESLLAQELIITGKHDQLSELFETKKAKVTLLHNKKQKFIQEHKDFLKQLLGTENQLNSKSSRFLKRTTELDALEVELEKIEKKLPRPLDEDFASLHQEDGKVTKDLVKYQKLCNQAIQAMSKREKEIYDYYYDWEKQQKSKLEKKESEKDCVIY